jgi:Spy/CpxP family protein refolding chaperone
MTALLKWKVALYLVAIFAAGGVSGWVVGTKRAKEVMLTPPKLEDFALNSQRHLEQQLHLSPEQSNKMAAVFAQYSAQMATNFGAYMQCVRQSVSNRNARIRTVLTPEQKEKFDQLDKERERRDPGANRRRPPMRRGGPGSPRGEWPPTNSPPMMGAPRNGEYQRTRPPVLEKTNPIPVHRQDDAGSGH